MDGLYKGNVQGEASLGKDTGFLSLAYYFISWLEG